jgi:hypothetical protein
MAILGALLLIRFWPETKFQDTEEESVDANSSCPPPKAGQQE